MTNPLEYSTVPSQKLETLTELVPAYSAQLDDHCELAVTPEAHDFFGFKPLVATVQGRLDRLLHENPRTPYTRVVLTAPHELSDQGLPHETVLCSTQAGENAFWMSHPNTPDEYVSRGFDYICRSSREEYPAMGRWSDERILEGVDRKAAEAQFRVRQVANMTNWLEPYIANLTTRMREMSFPQDERRKQMLAAQGIATIVMNQDTGLPMEGIQDITTLPQVAMYGSRRAYEVSCKVFGALCSEPFDLHRTNTGMAGMGGVI